MYVLLFFCLLSDMSDLAKNSLQSLKQWFESIAIEETITKRQPPVVIGDVFVKKAAAKIFLRACEELPSSLSSQSHLAVQFDVQESKHNLGTTVNCFEVIQILLQSSEYEVRLAVLEFVVSHLPNKSIFDCKAVLEEDASDNGADSWIFDELDGQLKSQLFTMAIKVEHHTDCLVKVTDWT